MDSNCCCVTVGDEKGGWQLSPPTALRREVSGAPIIRIIRCPEHLDPVPILISGGLESRRPSLPRFVRLAQAHFHVVPPATPRCPPVVLMAERPFTRKLLNWQDVVAKVRTRACQRRVKVGARMKIP